MAIRVTAGGQEHGGQPVWADALAREAV